MITTNEIKYSSKQVAEYIMRGYTLGVLSTLGNDEHSREIFGKVMEVVIPADVMPYLTSKSRNLEDITARMEAQINNPSIEPRKNQTRNENAQESNGDYEI